MMMMIIITAIIAMLSITAATLSYCNLKMKAALTMLGVFLPSAGATFWHFL